MLRLLIEARRRVVLLHSIGYSISSIFERLEQENVEISKRYTYVIYLRHPPYRCIEMILLPLLLNKGIVSH